MTQPVEVLEIEDIKVLETLNNPLRIRILRQLTEPRSVRDVAERFGVPPTRLYYHFNLLEEAGLIKVVETRKAGAMLQKVYQTTARRVRPSPKLVEGGHSPEELARITAGVVLDPARLDAEAGLTNHFAGIARGEKKAKSHAGLARVMGFFTPEQAEAFIQKLDELMRGEFDDDSRTEGREFGFSYVFFPLAGAEEEEE